MMDKIKEYLPWIVGAAGIWSIVNGILHTVFVLIKRLPFDKELVRLLMDGHILIFGGIFYFIAVSGLKNQQEWGFWLGITTSLFLLTYCALIFKMLPSVVFILINIIVFVCLVSQKWN